MSCASGVEPSSKARNQGSAITVDSDPRLTANIYCKGQFDRVIQGIVAPLWNILDGQEANTCSFLWFLRYARGGEHLKIRWHGPESLLCVMERSLEERTLDYLGRSAVVKSQAVAHKSYAPPMDLEDVVSEEYPDRSLILTTYQRSPLIFGPEPLLGDHDYVALFTKCLGFGSRVILATYETEKISAITHGKRQATLLALLNSGLTQLWPSLEERASFLRYHRDWLIRIPILRSRLGEQKAWKTLARYEAAAASLGSIAARQESREHFEAWGQALIDLRDYLMPFVEKPEYSLDPVAKGPIFPCLFKVFHVLSNQLGINPLNEGLAHHMLLRAIVKEGQIPFCLIPE